MSNEYPYASMRDSFDLSAYFVVGADDHDDVRLDVLDDVDGLVDGVGGAEVPVLAEALLRRDGGDAVAQ